MQFKRFLKFAHDHRIDIVPKRRYVGILFILFAWFMLALSTVTSTTISPGIPNFVTFFFNFLSGLIFYSIFYFLKGLKFLKMQQPFLVLLRGSLGIVTYYLFVFSKIWANGVDYSILLSMESIFVPIFMSAILKVKYQIPVWLGVSIGFLGVGLLSTFNVNVFSSAGIAGVSSGALLAIMVMLTSIIVYNDAPPRIAFYQLLIGVIISGIIALFNWQTPSLHDLGVMSYSGLLYALALFLFLDAFYYTEPHIIAMLGYSLVFFTEFIDWISNGIIPSSGTIYGFIFIIVGGYIVIFNSYKRDIDKQFNQNV